MVNKIANILVCTNGQCPADETCSNGNCVKVGSSITDSKTNTSVATSGSAHRKWLTTGDSERAQMWTIT